MAQGTARNAADYNDRAAAQSAVMAALGQTDESEVDASAQGDTDATEAAADEVEDSDESAEEAEESADEGTESDDDSGEPVEAKADKDEEEDSPFSAEDKAALAKAPKEVQKLAKGLQRSYTQKMQALGEVEKFKKQLEGDPQSILQRLAEANGLKVKFGEEAQAETTTQAIDPVSAVVARARERGVAIIGDEAADWLLGTIQAISSASSEARVKPLVESQATREREQATARFKDDFGRFEKEHPDWKQHETAMLELSKQVNPKMSPYDTANFLYAHVTRPQQLAKAKAEASGAAKVKRAVADAEPAPRTRIPGSKVKTAPPVYKTSRDAAMAAMAEQGYIES